jgi:hypothetical protein
LFLSYLQIPENDLVQGLVDVRPTVPMNDVPFHLGDRQRYRSFPDEQIPWRISLSNPPDISYHP